VKSLILLLTILAFPVQAAYMLLPIVEVYDGDTIKTNLSWRLPEPLNLVSIRIYGIDTPEMPAASFATTGKLSRAKCIKEAELALQAKALVVKITEGSNKMKVSDFKWDKYGGRILGNVTVNKIDIATALIEANLAVEYFGTGIKKNWCQ